MRNMTGQANSKRRRLFLRLCCIVAAMLAAPALLLAQTSGASLAQVNRPMLLQKIARTPPGPDFTLPDLDGQATSFKALRGKVVIVNFWATWCPPCRAEIPSMERAWQKLKGRGVVMLAIHVGGNADGIWDFVSEFDVTFPVLIDKGGKVSRQWQTIGLPTTYVVDTMGRKVLRAIGGREWDHPALIESIVALVKAR